MHGHNKKTSHKPKEAKGLARSKREREDFEGREAMALKWKTYPETRRKLSSQRCLCLPVRAGTDDMDSRQSKTNFEEHKTKETGKNKKPRLSIEKNLGFLKIEQ